MRLVSYFIVAGAFACAACSHTEKKADVAATGAKAAVQKKADDMKAKAESATAESATKVQCSVKGDERWLEVRDKGAGCEFVYTKAGKEGVVASSSHGKQYCEAAMTKLQGKLKGAGYDCK